MAEGVLGGGVLPLLWKELHQIRRSRGAMLSAILLPALMLLIIPLAEFATFRSVGDEALLTSGNPANQAMANLFHEPMDLYRYLLLPLFVTLSSLLAPTVTASYTVVAERERRSLDLLMALPVSVGEVLAAKVLSVLVAAAVVVLPLFAILMAVLAYYGAVTVGYILLLLLLLLSGFFSSIGFTTVVALVARDFRTANNLGGIQVVPLMIGLFALVFLVPSPLNLLLTALGLVVFGALALLIAWRWITFERYLS